MAVLMRRTGERTAFCACALALFAVPLRVDGQILGASEAPGGPDLPRWLTEWSPLKGISDLPRELPGAEVSLPALLTLPAPRVGMFWSAGNPGALAFETSDAYAQIRAAHKRFSGEYRRPLDAGNESHTGGSAAGWKTLGTGGAAIGRVVVERLHRTGNAHADAVLPFSSNPFTVLDTLGDALASTVIRLEGAGGWRLGNLGVGLGVGFEGREVRTEASPVPRQDRVSASGLAAGLAYHIAGGAFRLGVFGRRAQTAQTVYMYGYAENSLAYMLSGYYEPLPMELSPWGSRRVWRRFDRVAWAYGFSVGGRVSGVEWTGFAQLERAAEEQFIDEYANDPPTDDWDANGWTLGFAAQRILTKSRILVTVSARYAQLDGETLRMDLDEVNFTVSESAAHVTGEVRLLPRSGWGAAVQVAVGREGRKRRDVLARVGSDLKHWAPALSVEISRTLPRGFAVSAAGGISQHVPWGDIPAPPAMSYAYQTWIAPELSLYGTKAWSRTGALTLVWLARDGVSLWAQGKLAFLSPQTGHTHLQFQPEGSRTRSRIEVGVTMGGRANGGRGSSS